MRRTLSIIALLFWILPAWAGEKGQIRWQPKASSPFVEDNEITRLLPEGNLSPGSPQNGLLEVKEAPEAEPDPWDENRFFDKSREGWFWYLEMREEEREKDLPKRKAPSGPLPPTLKEMQEEAEQLLSRAVEEPTEAHLLAYIRYQRLVMKRAEAFAQTWQRVLWAHPEIDPTVENPVVTAGLSVARAEKAKKRDAKLLELARSSGIFYFFAGDCPLCEIQSTILANFARSYGFSVVPISLDGAEDPLFGPAKVDRGAAERLGVSAAPAIFLVRPQTGEVLRVGTGLLSMEDLGERLDRLAEHHVEEER